MFRKRKQAAASQQPRTQPQERVVASGGYVVTELPTFHGRQRKVVTYTSDSSGKIIKTIRKK